MATPRHTILVVDDEPDVVKSVQDLLRFDYRVLGATRASDGIKLMEKEEVHVVMSDQRMPEMTGVEFLHRIRGEYPEAIRLLFTGYADIRAVIDAINQGNVYRYITKPWDPDELQSVVREAVERYELLAGRKRLTEELKRKNAELEAANQKLAESNALKAAFIQVASHELRTPLTILLGLTDLAARQASMQEPLRDWVQRMRRAAQRLDHLVGEILTLLSAGNFSKPLCVEATGVNDLLHQAADDIRPFAQLRRQSLVVTPPAEPITVFIDRAKIRDALNHLLLNSIKFTPDEGEIRLRADRNDEGGVELTVEDTGVGIPTDELPKLFQPFFTGMDVSSHSSGQFEYCCKGLGLGLSIVRAFAEMHGGDVKAASEIGKGTTITIVLPGATAKAEAQPGVPAMA